MIASRIQLCLVGVLLFNRACSDVAKYILKIVLVDLTPVRELDYSATYNREYTAIVVLLMVVGLLLFGKSAIALSKKSVYSLLFMELMNGWTYRIIYILTEAVITIILSDNVTNNALIMHRIGIFVCLPITIFLSVSIFRYTYRKAVIEHR